MRDTIIHRTTRTVRRTPENHYDWDRMVVEAGLRTIGDQAPYFTVTCSMYRGPRDEGGGAAHETIIEHCPDLAPVVRVHLADVQGVPMHAVANAVYWAGLVPAVMPDERSSYGQYVVEADSKGRTWAPTVLANHLRISVDEARTLRDRMTNSMMAPPAPYTISGYAAKVVEQYIADELAARWQADADAALAILTTNTNTNGE